MQYHIVKIHCKAFNFVNFAIWDALQKLKLAHIFESIHFSYNLGVDMVFKNHKYFF